MSRADIAHRDDLFVELLDRVRARLKGVASAPEHEALVLGGGGTAATEAAFATFIAPEERLLVVSTTPSASGWRRSRWHWEFR